MSTIPPPNRDTTWGSFDRPTLAPSLRDYAAPAASNEPPRKSLILKQPLSRVHPFSTGARAVCLLRMTVVVMRRIALHSLGFLLERCIADDHRFARPLSIEPLRRHASK